MEEKNNKNADCADCNIVEILTDEIRKLQKDNERLLKEQDFMFLALAHYILLLHNVPGKKYWNWFLLLCLPFFIHNLSQFINRGFSLLADVYGATDTQIKQNFNNNEKHFKEGKHYFLLKGEELKGFKGQEAFSGYWMKKYRLCLKNGKYGPPSASKNRKGLYTCSSQSSLHYDNLKTYRCFFMKESTIFF